MNSAHVLAKPFAPVGPVRAGPGASVILLLGFVFCSRALA